MLLKNKIPLAYIFNKVKIDLFVVLVINIVVYLITHYFNHFLPVMPLTVPAFIGTSITILLSFKLNQSYDRWWEARKIWGSIVNDSRSFVIQLQTLVSKGNDTAIKKLAYRQIAWCYSLGQTLRDQNPITNIEEFLESEDFNAIHPHKNKPLALIQQHGLDIRKLRENNQLELFAQIQLDNTLVRLCDAMGRAERIKSTVFPTTYRLFLHFMIYLFIVTLDISLSNTVWYFEIPLLLIIGGTYFLLEKSATHMEDPFNNKPTDTAMTDISRKIEINIKQLLNETNIPSPHVANDFYIT